VIKNLENLGLWREQRPLRRAFELMMWCHLLGTYLLPEVYLPHIG
jgi:hypothetical protein